MANFSASEEETLGGGHPSPTVLRIARLYGLTTADVERVASHSQKRHGTLHAMQRYWLMFSRGLEGQDSTSAWLRWLSRKVAGRTPREVLLSEGVDAFARYVKKAAASHPRSFFIERRPQGDYAVRRLGDRRASAVESTQSEAIQKAKAIDSSATIHVERVRDTNSAKRNSWRQ